MKGNLSNANLISALPIDKQFDAITIGVDNIESIKGDESTGNAESGVVGSGFTPEGFDQSPAYYELIQGAPWRTGPVPNITDWLVVRAHRRYGLRKVSAAVAEAWRLLGESSYQDDLSVHDETGVGLLSPPADPRHWAHHGQPMPGLCKTWTAWGRLVDAAAEVNNSMTTYRYDLVNTGREVLAQLSTPLAINFSNAVKSATLDGPTVHRTGLAYIALLLDLDALVSTEDGFLLGPWLRDARAWGRDSSGAPYTDCNGTAIGNLTCEDYYEWNARTQVSTWYPTPAVYTPPAQMPERGRDSDYARKHWSPLIRDYYVPRAHALLTQALGDAAMSRPLNQSNFSRTEALLAYAWTTSTDKYPVVPKPGFVEASANMRDKYVRTFGPACRLA
jgi:alpha-N-acetylglucosaminidase